MADPRIDEVNLDDLPQHLPVLALRRGVLLPGAASPFLVGRARSRSALEAAHEGWLIVASQREPVASPAPSDLLSTGVLARVRERKQGPNGAVRVVLQGVKRVNLTGFPSVQPHLEGTWTPVEEIWPDTVEARGMVSALRAEVEASAEVLGAPLVTVVLSMPPALQVDALASAIEVPQEWAKEILSTHDPLARAERVLVQLVKAREALAARDSIKERVSNATRDQQREFLLRQQLKAIQEELGEGGEDDDLSRLRDRLGATDLPDEVQEVVDREIRRLERLSAASPERSVAIDWLEWIADMPWGRQTAVDLDLKALEEALDKSHYGLSDVKQQVVEHLAVRKLAGSGRADVLLLVGPPGVGKTSIGQAIADATGRKLVRVALGGVRDESELRGHRRTYIGARPGRLVEGVRRASTADPVILLDEVDKLGSGMWGDPASALLEILDPEQNDHFVDRYLEVPFDLSKALFVATANDLASIPGPLRDRMQKLEIAGYSQREKLVIAREHLLPTVARNAGLQAGDVQFTDAAIEAAIAGWTREAGVRELQRVLGKVYRAAAVRRARAAGTDEVGVLHVDVEDLSVYLGKRRFFDEEPEVTKAPGIARGLAWTPVGGDLLYVEASTLPGRGQLVLTGQLGDVMKESARAALTYVLAHSEALGIDPTVLESQDIHIHVPAGAVPKDGPSAGVTMFTTLASLLTGRPVRDDVAMTGEATLRGRVLPVGGIKSKVLAAHRHGMKRVILPKRNATDLEDVPEQVRRELDVVLVERMDEVLAAALVEASATAEVRSHQAA
ncbi:MAG: endopeptidase La [Myxococcales bacterium]|nr:endopeptidase La [Myxococcales bacterium]